VPAVVDALVPVLVLIALGHGLARIRFVEAAVWGGIERLTYFVLFPALLVGTLGGRQLGGAWPAWFAVVGLVLAIAVAVLLLLRRGSGDGPAFTSVFQGGVRFNTYIALAVIQALHGPEGLAVGALAAGLMIVLINVACIAALARWGSARIAGPGAFARAVLANPLIVACAVGWVLNLTGIGLPGASAGVLEVVGRAALPLGLLAVGAALRPAAIRGHLGAAARACLVQYGVKPVAALGALALLGVTGMPASVLLVLFAVPTASSAYILARQLGGDAEAMASIITVQTLAAFAVLPLVLLVAQRL
jgi:predicted permease